MRMHDHENSDEYIFQRLKQEMEETEKQKKKNAARVHQSYSAWLINKLTRFYNRFLN